MTAASWQRCLDRLAEHLDRQACAIRSGDLDGVQAFVPDAGLGPLPTSLAARAHDLSRTCDELARELLAARERTGRDLAALLRPETPPASFVDSRV